MQPLATRSFWQAGVAPPQYAPLAGHLNVDVCVIGAGLAGLSTAHQLTRLGVSVAVLEAFDVGSGETGRTTAHIAIPDDGFSYIESTYGADAARLTAQSFAAATDHIESVVEQEGIACEFRRLNGYLYSVANNPREALDQEFASAARAGVAVTRESTLPPGLFSAGPCLRFEGQAQFHPLKYLHGLAARVTSRRGVIHAGTRALSVEEREHGVVVTTPGGRVTADAVVLATNTPFHQRFAMHTKQAAYQTYAVAASVPRGAVPAVLLWDDGDPYFYVRTTPHDDDHDLLIVGGADHKTGQSADPEQHYEKVMTWTREHFPQVHEFAYRWSGEVLEPLDGMAYLGRSPGSRNVFLITGDSGNGMTHTVIGGLLVSDLILGRRNPWLELYDPSRKPLKEALQFVKDQTNIAAQFVDWATRGDEDDVAALAPGQGAIIRQGLKKFAVYRDESGGLHAHSAKCTHLGCVVQWNDAEKSWDCPCHGSRFSAHGAVVHGPAVSALNAIDAEGWRSLIDEPAKPTNPRPDART